MEMSTVISTEARAAASPTPAASVPGLANTLPILDPLVGDALDDEIVVTTRRGICRVALVATETAGRFQREGLAYDPMSWLLAPRRLFSGAAAIDACLERDACMRGILVHGLSLGLDVDPADLDALTEEDDSDNDAYDEGIDFAGVEFEEALGRDRANGGDHFMARPRGVAGGEPRLFTATVVANDGFETVQAFHASLAANEAEIAGRLYMRMGAAAADAVIVAGFDATMPLVAALVSSAICDTLALVASDPDSPLAAGLDLNVEQRFYG